MLLVPCPRSGPARIVFHSVSLIVRLKFEAFRGGIPTLRRLKIITRHRMRACLSMGFGMTKAAYVVVRLLQHFPDMKLPTGEKTELIGAEKQTMTLVLSSTNGCRVDLGIKKA